jgi:hypothetical protein
MSKEPYSHFAGSQIAEKSETAVAIWAFWGQTAVEIF